MSRSTSSTRSRFLGVLFVLCLAAIIAAGAGSAYAGTIVYEPFDYPVPPNLPVGSNFSGTAVGAGTGLTGTWTGTTGTYNNGQYKLSIDTPTLGYGILPGAGAVLRGMANAGPFGQVSIAPANLAGNLDDGDELWFSSIINNPGAGGQAVSFRIGTTDANSLGCVVGGTTVQAASWVGGVNTNAPADTVPNAVMLVVGKITFGATDTVDIYLPDTNLTLGPSVSTISAALAQSTFGLVYFKGGSGTTWWVDEIRLGTTYADVIGGKHAYWDLNGSGTGSGSTTPAGTWNAVDPNWNDSGDGAGTGTVAWAARARLPLSPPARTPQEPTASAWKARMTSAA